MKVIAINGSPRKTWNTATLLEHALNGAASAGADTEQVHLYDLDFKGCTSCFACKLKGGKSYGRCSLQDDLTPVLEAIGEADAVILGSPIYFGIVTGEMRSCMERILFPYLTYTRPPQSLFPRKIPTAFFYTMNVAEVSISDIGYDVQFRSNESIMERMFGSCESLFSYETLQFEDYSKMVFSYADPAERVERRKTVFPKDCEAAYNLGKRLVSGN
ncbi:MAG: flavodoxin family protein [Methanospirillum sp.]|uniref:flavodoxin family protein n=1 Tax=Methanospirillum sp. TaxID=45200 RepID=UPI00236CBF6D|nr:flavodoxin family protein [Methanospirillum sp.]MDD1727499.1 flavodoxin family protein [Methanospirillum sp.]